MGRISHISTSGRFLPACKSGCADGKGKLGVTMELPMSNPNSTALGTIGPVSIVTRQSELFNWRQTGRHFDVRASDTSSPTTNELGGLPLKKSVLVPHPSISYSFWDGLVLPINLCAALLRCSRPLWYHPGCGCRVLEGGLASRRAKMVDTWASCNIIKGCRASVYISLQLPSSVIYICILLLPHSSV